MPRQARVVLPNTPHHIMQRGHNCQAVFAADDDFAYYRANLVLLFKKEYGCKIYAYCLMTNHVHLIIDPGDNSESLSLLMKRVVGRQTRYVNKQENKLAACGKEGLNPALYQAKNICWPVRDMLS